MRTSRPSSPADSRWGGRTVSDEILNRILDLADHVSGDVQELCDALWASTEKDAVISESDLPIALELVFARESKAYAPIVASLTAIQMRVLRGIARLGGRQTLSKDFLCQTGVANAGSVRNQSSAWSNWISFTPTRADTDSPIRSSVPGF